MEDQRRVVWSEPALPKYVKINPNSPPGAAEGLQPGDMSMLKVAEEFLEEPEEGLALSGLARYQPRDVEPSGPGCRRTPVRSAATRGPVPDRWLSFAVAQYATYRVVGGLRDAQEWTRSFQVARYGSTAVTDAGRDAATAQLREHYAVGRLSLDQFQDRLDEVDRAQTARERDAATDGLPHVARVIPSGAPRGSYPGGYPYNAGHVRAALARTGRRILLAFAALTVGSLLVLALLITAFLVHGGLLAVVVAALLAILAVGVAAAGAWCGWPSVCGGAAPGSRPCRR